MVSSCAGLRGNSLRAFRKRFPNAYILGWLGSSPLDQKGLMRKFLAAQADTVDIATKAGISALISAWRTYIEGLPKGKGSVRQWGLGYASPAGDLSWYDGDKWHERKARH